MRGWGAAAACVVLAACGGFTEASTDTTDGDAMSSGAATSSAATSTTMNGDPGGGTDAPSPTTGTANDDDAIPDPGTTSGAVGGSTSTSDGAESSSGAVGPPAQSMPELDCADEGSLQSGPAGAKVDFEMTNVSGEVRRIWWLDEQGNRSYLSYLNPGNFTTGYTFVSHLLLITDDQDNCITIFEAVDIGGVHMLDLY